MAASSDHVPVLSDATLAQLAKAPLPYLRASRYQGQERSVELQALGDSERVRVVRLYQILETLDPATPEQESAVPLHVVHAELSHLLGQIGRSPRDSSGTDVRAVLHDMRGGAASALVSALEWLELTPAPEPSAFAVRLLARDHRKLMRSAIRDLDPPRRAHDQLYRPHSTEHLLRGLGAIDALHGGVKLVIDCRFDGAVTASCVELGSLERVLYNFTSNAARHSPDGTVGVWLLPVRSSVGLDLRIVVANFVDGAHAQTLRDHFGSSDLRALFSGQFSSTGSGVGLHTCAELVAEAFGLSRPDAALRDGHVGARLIDDAFVAWSHWPALSGRER